MSTSIIIKSTINPPPTKTEVIEGLLTIAKERFDATQKERSTRRQELQEQWDQEVALRVKGKSPVRFGEPQTWEDHEVTITVKTSRKMKQIAEEWDRNRPLYWDEKEERKMISEALRQKKSRVADFLADPTTRQSFEALADHLSV